MLDGGRRLTRIVVLHRGDGRVTVAPKLACGRLLGQEGGAWRVMGRMVRRTQRVAMRRNHVGSMR